MGEAKRVRAIRTATSIVWTSKMWCPDSEQLQDCYLTETPSFISKCCKHCGWRYGQRKGTLGQVWFDTVERKYRFA